MGAVSREMDLQPNGAGNGPHSASGWPITTQLRAHVRGMTWDEAVGRVSHSDRAWMERWRGEAEDLMDAIDAVHANLEHDLLRESFDGHDLHRQLMEAKARCTVLGDRLGHAEAEVRKLRMQVENLSGSGDR